MKEKRKLLYSLISGVIAVFLIYLYTEDVKERTGVSSGWAWVVKAKNDIDTDQLLTEKNIVAFKIPMKFYSQSMVLKRDVDAILHRKSMRRISAGDYVFWSDVKGYEEKISHKISEGKRLIAIGVDEVTSLGYSVREGDYVDVVLISGGFGRVVARDVKVKGVTGRRENGYSTLLLEVGSSDALALLLAKENGAVYFLLKNPSDGSVTQNIERSVDDLFKKRVEVIRGR